MQKINKINGELFFKLEKILKETKNDSDRYSFEEIERNLNNPKRLSSNDFVYEIFYVICASGFRQITAKKLCNKIIECFNENKIIYIEDLLNIYKNEKKINAIYKIWINRDNVCKNYYLCKTDEEKLNYLSQIPYIGKITKSHIGRNLGINIPKYDRWIQRLGVALYGNGRIKVDEYYKLNLEVKECCDKMFKDIVLETNKKIGYIDVVLFKACQQKLIKFNNDYSKVFF